MGIHSFHVWLKFAHALCCFQEQWEGPAKCVYYNCSCSRSHFPFPPAPPRGSVTTETVRVESELTGSHCLTLYRERTCIIGRRCARCEDGRFKMSQNLLTGMAELRKGFPEMTEIESMNMSS